MPHPTPDASRRTRRGPVLAALVLAMFMAAIEGTIVATAMPDIAAGLGGFALYAWVFASYLRVQAVTTPLFGKLADLHGREPVFVGGVALVVGASMFLALGTVHAAWYAAASSLVVGVGMGLLMTTFLVAVQTRVDWARRGAATATNMLMRILGNALGAALASVRPRGASDRAAVHRERNEDAKGRGDGAARPSCTVRQRHVPHGALAGMMGGARAPIPAPGCGVLPLRAPARPATERGRSMNLTHDTLRVLEAHVYRGPSAWGYRPMTRMVLDLGVLEDHPSSDLPGFPEALLERLPGLHEHGCSYGRPGGFASRLHEGTWLGHVIEHVAIELQNRLGADVAYGKTRGVRGRPGVYDVAYSHVEERVGPLAGRLAIRLVHDLLPPRMQGVEGLDLLVPEGVEPPGDARAPFDFEAEFETFSEAADRLRLGPSSRALAEAARERGIPVRRLDGHSLLQLGHGRHARRIRAGVTGATSALAVETAGDKALTNELLEAAGLPVPRLAIVDTAEDAVAAAARIGRPVVVKPLDGNHGRGVSLDLPDDDAVRAAFEEAAGYGRVVVEEHVAGDDHRLLVVDGRLVAAARRVPAHVVGDGRRSVRALVEEANRDPRRGRDHDRPLTRIVLDEHADRMLARRGYDRDSVPAAGEHVVLRATANLSTGGTATDVTDEVHPDTAAVAERAARAIGLDVAGIDVVTPRLDRPLAETGGAIVEVNAGPGLRMHHAPSHGRPRDAAGAIVDMLFPDGSDGRIPLVAITGTNGKTTTARMVARLFEAAGDRVGLATSSGITIGGRKVADGDTTGPWSAHVVLGDPTVDVAVLETARGGMLRSGLAFDRASVGAVLNVQSDHLGEHGIDTLDDMAWIKSLVAEIADPSGYAVLNADDERTAAMAERAGGEVVLFSMSDVGDGPRALREHVRAGGVAVVRQASRRGDLLAVVDDGRFRPVLWSHEIPATLDGLATVNVQNALAAVAIGYVSGLRLSTIASGLRTFTASYEDNPGRLNVYDGHPFRAVLDYGHNPAGLEALADLVPHLARGGRAIGVVTAAGDRRDEDAVAAGRVAARLFDHVVVREDADLRGREPGEVARLVVQGLREAGFPASATEVVLPEMEALRTAMRSADPGDLVLHFAERYEEAWETITGFEPDVRVPAAASAHDLPQRP